jgi:hypothetical protein
MSDDEQKVYKVKMMFLGFKPALIREELCNTIRSDSEWESLKEQIDFEYDQFNT